MSQLDALIGEAVRAAVARALDGTRAERRPPDFHTAIHEAAHCCVGWLVHDMPIIEVTLGDDGSGAVRRESPLLGVGDDGELLRVRLERAIVAVYAGLEADDRGGRVDWAATGADVRLIQRFAGYLLPPGAEQLALRRRLREVSMLAVHDHWAVIEALAARLARERRLAGCDVERWLGGRCGPAGGYAPRG
ncbi:MAG: hypothetical protein ACYDAN_02480 [Candidatus Limnocylindrales bacterium]